MTVLAIELNDTALNAASPTLIAQSSPGYALLREPELVIGMEAYSQAKLYPRHINNRFWHQISLDPIERTLGVFKTHADLAYAHLMQLFKPYRGSVDGVIFGVPGCFSKKQLGLLLGICQRAEVPVVGLVDAALASVCEPTPGNQIIVLDATQHCFLINELVVDNGLRCGRSERLDHFGLNEFYSRWATFISESFIKNTRFDPMHSARSEQWLNDALPGFIEQINTGSSDVEFANSDGEYTTSINYEHFVAAVTGLYQPIINALANLRDSNLETTMLVTDRVAKLTGLLSAIEHYAEFRVVRLEPQVVTKSIISHEEHYASSDKKFSLIQQKPWQATPSLVTPKLQAARTDHSRERNLATHALIGDQAFLIGDNPFVLGTSLPANQWGYQVNGIVKGISRNHCSVVRRGGQIYVDDTSTFGTYVNGSRVKNKQLLQVGDKIQIGNPGIEVNLIRQVMEHGKG